ncbi:MAG: histidine kinase [Algicola sp.]|nr:histidine kinase [Algicola sp.]
MAKPTKYNNDIKKIIRHVFVLLLTIGMGLLIYVVLSQVSDFLTSHNFKSDFVNQLTLLLGKVWLPWVALSPLVVIIALRFPISPNSWPKLMLGHFVMLLILSLLHGLAISYYHHYFGLADELRHAYLPIQHIGHFLFGSSFFLFNLIIYMIFIASFNLRSFYNIAQQKDLETIRLSHKLTESKLLTLRMQINPHFLFNTLNVISVLILKKDNDKANDMIDRLSAFFRQTLDDSSGHWVTLQKELDMTSQYLDIEKLRFGDRLTVIENYAPEVLSTEVPSMILQPLVENAVRHGLEEKEEPGTLTIECMRLADRLLIQIKDDGVGCTFEKDANFHHGIGLTNVKQRLEQMYGTDHVFSLSGKPERGVTVSIELPLNRKGALR